MATPAFNYQDPFPLAKDDTEYRLLTNEYVETAEFEGQEILKIKPEALTLIAQAGMRDVSFFSEKCTSSKWLLFWMTLRHR